MDERLFIGGSRKCLKKIASISKMNIDLAKTKELVFRRPNPF